MRPTGIDVCTSSRRHTATSEPATTESGTRYRDRIYQWISGHAVSKTSPDLAFTVTLLSQLFAKRVFRHPSGKVSQPLHCRRSLLTPKTPGPANLLCRRIVRQPIPSAIASPALDTLGSYYRPVIQEAAAGEAEYMTMSLASRHLIWLHQRYCINLKQRSHSKSQSRLPPRWQSRRNKANKEYPYRYHYVRQQLQDGYLRWAISQTVC